MPQYYTTSANSHCDACLSALPVSLNQAGDFNAHKCPHCGLTQTRPMPEVEELKAYYSAFGFLPPDPQTIKNHLASIRKSLNYHLGPCKAGESLLDYGGGYGLYAKAARDLGWDVALFDYDIGALDFATRELGLNRQAADLASFSDESFDVIWAFHVAEHWRSIDDSFNDLDRLVKPGGRLILATPNARSWEKYLRSSHFRNYLKAWRKRGLSLPKSLKLLLNYDSVFCWDPPRHLYAFTPESFRQIGIRRGYSTEIRVGSNNNSLFEPRRYIIASPRSRFHSLVSQLMRRPWKLGAGLAVLKLGYEQLMFGFLDLLAPMGGEQLYVVYTKK